MQPLYTVVAQRNVVYLILLNHGGALLLYLQWRGQAPPQMWNESFEKLDFDKSGEFGIPNGRVLLKVRVHIFPNEHSCMLSNSTL
jgi:hypothetical protein